MAALRADLGIAVADAGRAPMSRRRLFDGEAAEAGVAPAVVPDRFGCLVGHMNSG